VIQEVERFQALGESGRSYTVLVLQEYADQGVPSLNLSSGLDSSARRKRLQELDRVRLVVGEHPRSQRAAPTPLPCWFAPIRTARLASTTTAPAEFCN